MKEYKVNQKSKERRAPRLLFIECENRRLSRVQLHDDLWFARNIRYRDILTLVHNQQKDELTQLALFAGHRLYLDYKDEKIFEEYLLGEKTNTWWEGDILDHQGEVVAKAPDEEILSLIRDIPSRFLIRPEELNKGTPSFLGGRLFNFVSKGGFDIYTKECDCKHCNRHLQRLDSDPDYLWYI